MNRFKDTLDELRQRRRCKQIDEMLLNLPKITDLLAPTVAEESNGGFKLPYSSDPTPIVEPWK